MIRGGQSTPLASELAELRDRRLEYGMPWIREAEIADVVDSLRSGWVGTGPKVHRFEQMLARYVSAAHCRCLSSCTAALMLSLRLLGIGPGDEILVPAITFAASANAVELTGATPVLVDTEPGTGLIDLDAAAAAVTSRTRAIIPVHLAGRPLDMDRLERVRDRYGLAVIEDAAHALGAEWRGRRIGGFGNLTAFSFSPPSNITTIEGGALVTEHEGLAQAIERLALHGLSAGAWQRYSEAGFRHYEVIEPGFKYNMTDIQAAVGLGQLPQIDRWIEVRAQQWERYDQQLAGLPLTTPRPPAPNTRHARNLYQVLIGDDARASRDGLAAELAKAGIGTAVHYRALHMHPYYRNRYNLTADHFPIATGISMRTLSLPLGPTVDDADQDRVVAALRATLTRAPAAA